MNGNGLELAQCGMLPSILNSYTNCVDFPGRFVSCCRYLASTLYKSHCLAHPGILFGGVSANSVEDRGQRERGSGGGSPLVRGSGGSCTLIQEISFHIIKVSQFFVL